MECYEEGILTKEHTGGLELKFGNGAAALELLHQMARGEGFGVIVGQGVRYMKEYFAREFGGDPAFMHDIGMEIKAWRFRNISPRNRLPSRCGYGMATKGPQHDEAWLIFMDQVHNLLPTFEDKAEALHYFPMWRTWFSLHGLCKLPWNDISPANNKETKEPAKVEEHVENYTWIHQGVTGIPTTPKPCSNNPRGCTTSRKFSPCAWDASDESTIIRPTARWDLSPWMNMNRARIAMTSSSNALLKSILKHVH